ncbi:MAG TPA: phosphate signaling complex protein PhoU [Mycobacteriales bacterium]|nr:phosphate signaling complex protein PhoU [Mycobacteriales bacterium]
MRRAYEEQLGSLQDGLAALARLATRAVTQATRALVEQDAGAAREVIDLSNAVHELHEHLDTVAMDALARQQPVGSDLRVIVSSMRMSSDLTRVADYAVHVARSAGPALPDATRATLAEMGGRAAAITAKAADVVASRDLDAASSLLLDDDAVDRLNQELIETLLGTPAGIPAEQVVGLTLVGRYYERLADHAAGVARSVAYIVTGAPPGRHLGHRPRDEADEW